MTYYNVVICNGSIRIENPETGEMLASVDIDNVRTIDVFATDAHNEDVTVIASDVRGA